MSGVLTAAPLPGLHSYDIQKWEGASPPGCSEELGDSHGAFEKLRAPKQSCLEVSRSDVSGEEAGSYDGLPLSSQGAWGGCYDRQHQRVISTVLFSEAVSDRHDSPGAGSPSSGECGFAPTILTSNNITLPLISNAHGLGESPNWEETENLG